jgi:uncharacterized protein (TIGR04222 family)
VVTGRFDAIADPVEKAVAQDILATDGAIEQVFQKSQGMKDSIRSRLEQLGLFLSDAQALKAQIYPSLIVVILLGIGLCKMAVGISGDKLSWFTSHLYIWASSFGSKVFCQTTAQPLWRDHF